VAAQIIYYQNDTVLEVRDLRNGVTGDYLDQAALSVTVYDSTGAQVAGAAWPLAMSYVAASNGKYRVTLPAALALQKRDKYTAVILADGGVGLDARWEIELSCQQRS
jgi:hypothetical protein